MDDLRATVFVDLEPPSGGLARLRTRIGRRRRGGWWLLVVAVLAASWFVQRRPTPRLELDAGGAWLGGSTPTGIVSLDPGHLAVLPVAEAPGVRMYRVAGWPR